MNISVHAWRQECAWAQRYDGEATGTGIFKVGKERGRGHRNIIKRQSTVCT